MLAALAAAMPPGRYVVEVRMTGCSERWTPAGELRPCRYGVGAYAR